LSNGANAAATPTGKPPVRIGREFFPAQDATSLLIAAFGVFAAGFLMRPLGSLVFGHIGDKLGRKLAPASAMRPLEGR
jgi:MFS family permease